jgi:uncharacterized protein (DUF433 family)
MTEEQLIQKWIDPESKQRGRANARMKESHIHVWALIGYWFGVEENADEVAWAYDIPREAVDAALAYYRQHKCLIDDRLEANAGTIT